MCELLLFAKNNTQADPAQDRMCYKRGMVVAVGEDGRTWGNHESKQQWIAEGNDAASWPGQGLFVIIKVPGVPAAKAETLLELQDDDDTGLPQISALGAPEYYRLRRWHALVDNLPQAVRDALVADGEYTTTVVAIRNYLQRIRDAAQYTGLD